MAIEFFFPEDGQDKNGLIVQIATEIASAQDFVGLLKDRSEEVTSTDLDLSCSKPYNFYDTQQVIHALHANTDLNLDITLDKSEDAGIIQLQDLPEQQLKDYFRAITLGYRRAVLNILLGIGIHYKKAEGILPDFGPSRNTPYQIAEDIMAGETVPVVSHNAFIKSGFESDMLEVMLGANEAWSEMFGARDHKTLATRYLKRKITEEQLVDTISGMKEPAFNFKDE